MSFSGGGSYCFFQEHVPVFTPMCYDVSVVWFRSTGHSELLGRGHSYSLSPNANVEINKMRFFLVSTCFVRQSYAPGRKVFSNYV